MVVGRLSNLLVSIFWNLLVRIGIGKSLIFKGLNLVSGQGFDRSKWVLACAKACVSKSLYLLVANCSFYGSDRYCILVSIVACVAVVRCW